MTNRTFWDEEFKELNSIELSENQKEKLWKNIAAAKKKNKFDFVKNGLIFAAALALFVVLTMSFISGKLQTKDHSASSPAKPHSENNSSKSPAKPVKVVPALFLYQKDSADWELISRERYDEGIIEKIDTNQNQVSITVKRLNTYGSDTDPLGLVIKPDTETQIYHLKTSEPKQTLQLQENQRVLLTYGQYQPKGPDWFWGAEVVGVLQKDDKFYNSDGDLLNLNISSQVTIVNGVIMIAK